MPENKSPITDPDEYLVNEFKDDFAIIKVYFVDWKYIYGSCED